MVFHRRVLLPHDLWGTHPRVILGSKLWSPVQRILQDQIHQQRNNHYDIFNKEGDCKVCDPGRRVSYPQEFSAAPPLVSLLHLPLCSLLPPSVRCSPAPSSSRPSPARPESPEMQTSVWQFCFFLLDLAGNQFCKITRRERSAHQLDTTPTQHLRG